MNITTLGIDIAKRVFQLHGIDSNGEVVLKQKVTRDKLLSIISNLPKCLIGLEACGGSHYWAREFSKWGHTVRLMHPQFVKAYVKSNKNDALDAEAICEAVARPSMRFVPVKNIEQQDIQSIHRVRETLVKNRTQLANQIRGLLGEYGVVIPQGISYIRSELPIILENKDNKLSARALVLFRDLLEDFKTIDQKVKVYDNEIEIICKQDKACQRLTKVPGIGPLIATALVASISDGKTFKNGRELSAYLGLVPRQNSSGSKNKLLGISKRGDKYIRKLLIHGARSAMTRSKSLPKKLVEWINRLINNRGFNKACVALANKVARIAWVIINKKQEFYFA